MPTSDGIELTHGDMFQRNITSETTSSVAAGISGFANVSALCDDRSCNGSDAVTTSLTWELVNVTSAPDVDDTTPRWRYAMNVGVLFMATIGVIANLLTFVTLTVNGRAFSRMTGVLLKHQSLIDAVVCTLASGVFMQTSVWHVGVYAIDVVICFVWHNQYIYWAMVFMSVWNLVFIAVDRLIAVCFPIKYMTQSPIRVKIAIGLTYLASIFIMSPSVYLVSFLHGRCKLGISLAPNVADKFYYWFSIFYLFVSYIIPVVSFIALYSRTILQLHRQRTAIASVMQSHTPTRSTVRVTKCAITVTAIFIVTISYDSIYFFLGNVGVTSYDLGSAVQLVGVLLTVCNSLANPFMYIVFMPAFRRSLKATICRRRNSVQDAPTS